MTLLCEARTDNYFDIAVQGEISFWSSIIVILKLCVI